MDFLRIICFLGSGIGQLFIICILIGLFIPQEFLGVYGLIVALLLICGIIFAIASFMSNLF